MSPSRGPKTIGYIVRAELRDGGMTWSEGGMMKTWPCTGCACIPISLRDFPHLAKGGPGGVVPAKPGASSAILGRWLDLRNCR
jgi:hypothetical protein